MTDFNEYLIINKKAWDKRTPIHLQSKFYKNNEFKNGKTSLNSIELDAIGNVEGKSLLHLQCHFGQDSISFGRMGARVTGVDFSDVAISLARKLSKETKVHVDFVEGDVLKLNLEKKFDIIFSSYGVLGWIPELNKWANTISNHLKKGGLFLLTEFHPFVELIKDNGYDYFYSEIPDVEIENGTYTDGGENLITKTCWWNHSLTDIFTALESNNLKLTFFEEFDYSPYKLEDMIEKEKGKYVLKKRINNSTPYVFNLKATKK